MCLYLRAVSGGLSLFDGKLVPVFPHKEDAMVQSSQKGKTNYHMDLWHGWTQSHCAVSNNSLPPPSLLIFPTEPSKSYYSHSLNAQVPATLGLTPPDLLQPPSFCKTVSGTAVCPGDITDEPKQNHQPRPSFSSCHPLLQQQESR